MQTALGCRDCASQSQVLNKHHVQSLQVTACTRERPPSLLHLHRFLTLGMPNFADLMGTASTQKPRLRVLSDFNLEVSNREFIQMQLEPERAFFFF